MKEIPLSRGLVALCDDEDFEQLSAFSWCAVRTPKANTFYAASHLGKKLNQPKTMHRFLMPGVPRIDHKNRNGLDNRRENLRSCSASQNISNSKLFRHNTTGYRGVVKIKGSEPARYLSRLKLNGKQLYFGTYNDPREAALVRDAKALELLGEFASLNFEK